MDKYLVDPFARWIVHSTGWSKSKAVGWARTLIVAVFVVVAVFAFWSIQPK